MIIWGFKSFENNLGNLSLSCECNHCHNQVQLQAKQIGKKFSLFFIPLFSTSAKYYALCPICNYGYETNKDEIEKYLIEKVN